MPTTRAREVDPSRTILLRRQARTQLRRRFSAFKAMLRKAPQDSLETFQQWLETALQRSGLMDETLWQQFIYAAFKKGVSRGYEDSKGGKGKAKEEFTSDALAATTKQTLLADRAFDEMENCLTDLGNRLARVVTTALLANDSKDKLAAVADGGEWRAEVIARTEMIRAHAEGQLHALHRLGHRVVGVMAEFHSTDDDLTCAECEALDGVLYELDAAHGVIPVHPLCRCAWLPAYEPDDDDGGMAMNRWVTPASGQHVVVGDDGAVTPRPKYGSTDQPYWHPGMNPTVDMVVTRDGDKGKEVLLIKRSKDSKAFPNQWALPGGFHDTSAKKGEPWKAGKETKRQAAIRELKEETGVEAGVKVARVGVFQGPGRDPRDNSRAWSQSTAFRVHVPAGTPAKGADDAQAAKWVPVDKIGTLAFDHAKILAKAGILANFNPNHGEHGRFSSLDVSLSAYAGDRVPEYDKDMMEAAAALKAGDTDTYNKRLAAINTRAADTLRKVLADIPDAHVKIDPGLGVFDSVVEPSIRATISAPVGDEPRVLARMAYLGETFKQSNVFIRKQLSADAAFGPTGKAGVTNEPYIEMDLKQPITTKDLDTMAKDAGLFGATLGANGKMIFVHGVGTNGQYGPDTVAQFERLGKAVAKRGILGSTRKGVVQLRNIGSASNGGFGDFEEYGRVIDSIPAKDRYVTNDFDESRHARDATGEFTSGPEHAGVEAITTARANEFLPRTKGMDKGKMLEEVAACLAPKGWKATIESGDNALVVTAKRGDGAWSKARLERYHGEVTCTYEHLYTPLGDHGDNAMYAMASQMQHLAENGVDKLRFTAAKSAAHNGYYIWAKLGGDAPMPLVTRAKLLLHGINASTVQGLLAKPGGDKLWEKYGQECEMTLDLKHSKASKLIGRKAKQVANAAKLHDWLADGPPGIVVNEFDESKHPRDHGKFAMADDNSTEELERTLDVLSVQSHEFAEKLTPDEKSTLKEYSQSIYFYLNSQMRKCPPDYECLAPLMKAYMKDMDSAFEKAKPLPHPVEVARFIDVGKDMGDMLTGAESKLKAGGPFIMPSYTSTSLDAAHWEHNQDFGGAGKLKFAIKARTGVYMSHELSAHPQEAELLQSPKAKYKVAGVDRATNTIHLEEVLPTANYNPNHDEKGQFAADPAAKLAGLPEEKNYDKEDEAAITKLRGMQKAGDFLGAGRWFEEYDGVREARQDEVMKSLDFMKNEKPNVAGVVVTRFTGFDDNGHDRRGMTRTKDFVRNYLDPSIRLNKYEDPLRYLQTPINRAGYEGTTNYIYAQHADFHTFVHEMGHAIQANNPRVHEAVVAFFNKRLGNEAPKNLTLIDPAIKNPDGSPEYGRQDDFKKLFDDERAELQSHYVGKAYGVDAITNYKLNHRTGPFDAKDISNTEILSMGMEQMVKTPALFAKRDPEFFNLVHDVMRGKYTK